MSLSETEIAIRRVEGKIKLKKLQVMLEMLDKHPELFMQKLRTWMHEGK